MLDWLKRIFAQTRHVGPSPVLHELRVTSELALITIHHADGSREGLAWTDLGRVSLVTGEPLIFPPKLIWTLESRDRRNTLLIPMGAEGERDLVRAMRQRLHGFDKMTVIEAMSAPRSQGFTVWDSEWPQASGGY